MGYRRETLEYLYRKQDPVVLLKFFQDLSEGLSVAFADAARLIPASRLDRPAVYARGNVRRMLLDRALRQAAEQSGIGVSTGRNVPPTWSFPVVKLGAFSLTIGVVDRQYAQSARRLRTRGQYVKTLAQRNTALNPQAGLFKNGEGQIQRIVPDGTFGALIVVEPSMRLPDTPMFIGLWIPSPGLRKVYLQCSLDRIVHDLRKAVAEGKRPVRVRIERKKPTLRRKSKDSGDR